MTKYYVDFDRGNDASAGTSAYGPWKRAPGDPLATGLAKATKLAPGDSVLFRGGVGYRGSIVAAQSGVPSAPITYGSYGQSAGIIEGGDPVLSVVPCKSAADAGGAANWQALSVVTYTQPATSFIKFYDLAGPMTEAQIPAASDPFFADDVGEFAVSPLSERANIEAGRLKAPALAAMLGSTARGTLQLWIAGNLVVQRPVTGVDGNTLLFPPNGLKLYTDRDGRYALAGLASAISAPGQYAVVAPGKAVVWLRSSGPLWVGNGRGGFDLRNRNNIVITGLTFRHQTGAAGTGQGAAIVRAGVVASGLSITNNRFEHSALWNGQGVITLSGINDAVVSGNTITRIERGSGLRASGLSRLKVTGNRIDAVGRTGIMGMGISDSEITGNTVTNLLGVHGNGISLYLNNRRVRVADNHITGTVRPMTYHGDKATTAPGDHDLIIERNVFTATPDAQAALTSWGYNTRGVTIRNNVLIAPKGGLLTNGSDERVTVTGNYVSGLIVYKGEGAGWHIADNRTAPKDLTLDGASLCSLAGVPAGQTLGGVLCR